MAPFPCGGLIGRDVAVARVAETLAGGRVAAAGILVTGDPGMGKTSLLNAAVSMADGFQTLAASGIPVESKLPFGGLQQLLHPLLPMVALVPARQRATLESALALGPSVPHDEFAVAAGVLTLLGVATEHAPLLLTIDDAQWIDTPSLEALLFAFRRLRDESVALFIATRLEAAPTALRAVELPEIRLERLDAGAALALAARHVSAAIDPAALDRIVQISDGVPLALVALAGLSSQEPFADISSYGGPVAQLVQRLFGQRMEQLSPLASSAALIAALDEPTELDAFLRAGDSLGVSPGDWEQAERSGVLHISPGRLDFNHPLLREAALSRAAPGDLRRAHLALADAISARGDQDRAIWHRAAGTCGADEAIATELEAAADNYRRRAGHLTAARAFLQSAQLSATAELRARRLLLAGDSARRAGQPAWADNLALQAIAATSDPSLQARAELLRAHVEARQGSMEVASRRYQRVAERTASRDIDLAALALSYASSAAIVVGDVAGALADARRAALFPATRLSEATRISVQESLGFVMALRGDTAHARRHLIDAANWYERQPERLGAEYVAEALMWLGDYQRVRRLLDDLIADARGLGAAALLIQTLVLRADLGYRTGEWPSALADATEAVSLAEDTAQSIPLAYALAILALLEALTGSDDHARDHADRARQGAHRHCLQVVDESASFAIAARELAAGDPEATIAQLERTAAAVAATGRGEPAVVLWPAELIEALITLDRRADAVVAVKALEAQAYQTGGAWALGVVSRYRGVMAHEDDYDAIFTQAIQHHVSSAMPFELARTRFCYGRRLRRSGRRVASRVELRAAHAVFDTLRAVKWVERTERELAGSGEHLRRGPSYDRDQLTPQELQIARLIGLGATNREAAADLFLSPKTIETHLTRIYRKLGIRSRSELALVMGEQVADT